MIRDGQVLDKRILEFIASSDLPLSSKDIVSALPGKSAMKFSILHSLVKASMLVRSGEGVKGKPYKYSFQKTNHDGFTSETSVSPSIENQIVEYEF
ncbi:MAG: hypothetical protein EOP04_07790 [Proteobacteria bacterium]|nr:MAG: hypothetical protein EOP04_07790 [Pseudomonadota bacterium]